MENSRKKFSAQERRDHVLGTIISQPGITEQVLRQTTKGSGVYTESTLWQLQRKGLIRGEWIPNRTDEGEGKKGSRYLLFPGPNAHKKRLIDRKSKEEAPKFDELGCKIVLDKNGNLAYTEERMAAEKKRTRARQKEKMKQLCEHGISAISHCERCETKNEANTSK